MKKIILINTIIISTILNAEYLYTERSSVKDMPFIVTDSAPEAEFSLDSSTGMVPLTINITDLSTDDIEIDTVSFDYGDGNSGTDLSHTYTTDGTFTLTQTVTDSSGKTDTFTQEITVNPDPNWDNNIYNNYSNMNFSWNAYETSTYTSGGTHYQRFTVSTCQVNFITPLEITQNMKWFMHLGGGGYSTSTFRFEVKDENGFILNSGDTSIVDKYNLPLNAKIGSIRYYFTSGGFGTSYKTATQEMGTADNVKGYMGGCLKIQKL